MNQIVKLVDYLYAKHHKHYLTTEEANAEVLEDSFPPDSMVTLNSIAVFIVEEYDSHS